MPVRCIFRRVPNERFLCCREGVKIGCVGESCVGPMCGSRRVLNVDSFDGTSKTARAAAAQGFFFPPRRIPQRQHSKGRQYMLSQSYLEPPCRYEVWHDLAFVCLSPPSLHESTPSASSSVPNQVNRVLVPLGSSPLAQDGTKVSDPVLLRGFRLKQGL